MKSYLAKKTVFDSNYSVLLVLFVTTVILFIRKTDALTNPQFWAEDGTIFFLQQYNDGASVLLQEYVGYLHLAPRLIALVADMFIPYALTPAFYNYSSLLITLIVVMSVFSSRFHMKNKILIALTISLIPHYANEIFLNATNLIWLLSIMIIIVLFKEEPAARYGNVAVQYTCDLAIIIVCGLTGPFIILLMPFFLWKWVNERNSYNTVMLSATFIISLIQLSFIVAHSLNSHDVSTNFSAYNVIIGRKMFGGLFLGSYIAYEINHYLLSFLYLGILVLLLYLAYQKKNRFIFFCVGISLIYLLAAFYRYRVNPEALILPGNGTRYFYVPYLMITWSLIALLGQREKWENRIVKIALVLILISSLTSGFHSKPFVDYNWTSYSQSIGKEDIVIPINPPSWQINVKAHTR